MHKKRMTSSILISFTILTIVLVTGFISTNSHAFVIDNWNQIKDHEDVSGFVFHLSLHSWLEREYLEWNEFVMGDLIDYCSFSIVRKNPEYLEIEPVKIIITSPNIIPYEANFSKSEEENFFTAGKFTQSVEDAIATLNESGIWSLELIFNDNTSIKWIYTNSKNTPDDFTDSSEFHVFYGSLINVYTNLEYQQLKSAKLLQKSAEESAESTSWLTRYTFASFLAVAAAIGTIILTLYLSGKERRILYARQNRIEFYEPLYNEVNEINKKLNKFEQPFNLTL